MIFRTIVFVLLTTYSLTAVAQFTNVLLEERNSCDPAVAINRRNPLNMIAASSHDHLYVTNDGGKNWTQQKMSSAFGLFGKPVLVADGKGTFYGFYLSDPSGEGFADERSLDAIVCKVSTDGGKTWDDGNAVGFNPPKDQANPYAVADSKGNILVAWTQFDRYSSNDSTCTSAIMLSTSSNGKKWTKPVQMSNVPGNCLPGGGAVYAAVAGASDDKKVYVSWSNGATIFMDRSFDGGNMWLSNDIIIRDRINRQANIKGFGTVNTKPILRVDRSKAQTKGLMYLIWPDQRTEEGDAGIWFMRSNNFGDYWSTPIKVGGEKTQTHQYMPAFAIDNASGFLYVLYYNRGSDEEEQTNVYLAYSTDAGTTFKTVKVNETSFVPDRDGPVDSCLNLDAHNGVIVPVWTRFDGARTSVWTTTIRHQELPK